MSEFVQRILTGLVGAPVVIGLVYIGGWPLGLFVVAVAVTGQREIYRMLRAKELEPMALTGYLLGVLLVWIPVWPSAGIWALVAGLLVLGSIPFRGEEEPLGSVAATLVGIIYPPILLSSVLYLRLGAGRALGALEAFNLTALVLILVWVADTGAYYVGKAVGRRPLAPEVSPNKTWEGFLGGVLSTVVVGLVAQFMEVTVLSGPYLAGLVLISAVGPPIGDLLASRLKRSADVKDAGSVLPGHGGVMDRIDGLVYTLPVVVLYLRYVAGLW